MSKKFSNGKSRSQRQLRVAELIRRTLAQTLADWTPDSIDMPLLSITVGEVRISPDLKRATVFVLPLGGQLTEEVVTALNLEQREIRRVLSKKVSLKYSPALHFLPDPAFDQMDRTRRLLGLEDVRRDLETKNLDQET